MTKQPLKIMLVEDDAEYARFLRAFLHKQLNESFEFIHYPRMKKALDHLRSENSVDVVLLDLTLPDVQGLDTVKRVQEVVPEMPIVVLSALDDETMALKAVQAGAQDYLFKGQDLNALGRSIKYAMERKSAQAQQEALITRLGLLRSVDEELSHRLDVGYVLMMALDAAVRLSSANAGLIGLIENNEVYLIQNIGYEPQALIGWNPLESGIIARCIARRQAERVVNVHDDPEYVPVLEKTEALIAMPLLSSNRLIGFLRLETRRPERFSEDVFRFLTLLTSRIAISVENSQLYQTSQRQLARLRELYDQVSALEELKTDMIRIAAHDLRNPISNSVGYLWLLKQESWEVLDENQRGYIEQIEGAISRMQTITNDILSLDRFERGSGVDRETLNLQELVEKAYRELQGQAALKQQEFFLNMTANPVMVAADATLLYEAINNIVNNAIKYTPEGGRVEVRLKRATADAIFEVVDTGIGVPKEQQRRIFQPFFRAQSPEMVGIEGTGLGLHLVKNIIERHDGKMIFESVYGQGSTFGFHMPLEFET